MPNYPNVGSLSSRFPLFPKRTVNEWTHSNSHQPFTKERIQNLRPTIKQDARVPSRRITLGILFFFNPLGTFIKTTIFLLTFKIGPESYVASVRTTMGPMRVLNFPVVSQKRRPSRPLDYCLGKTGDLWRPKASLPSPQRTRTHNNQQQHFKTFSIEKNTTYLFQIVHSGIFHFPLSFHSAVAPCAPPPL